ncbi:UDP-N-acetylmuramate--L-alanine ligase [Solitalea koreensis]|uniref:UDP-N-acetylmuramate--L-alanine ligase n=1 Tax=Solitalea koreensis TaxID=543615 RepID=A0A521E3W1_9SPHI|nr:UDP-N-acetylmuramate--L-alanine ligase [Solitalea koreensis]SMO78627.1 UDP-N-acetylmuramate--L-alanine ligase [Solitalea koreensis]
MKLEKINKVYLVGIGGIGMSGLARWFKHRGCQVAGYDRTETELTKELVSEGIAVTYTDEVSAIITPFNAGKEEEEVLIIYTPAIPKSSKILNFFQFAGFDLQKRSQVLGIISEGSFCIAIAGTHGKTTTSTIVAHLLKHSGYDCSAFLGGIASNYNTNLLLGENNVMVVEADEFDRSFLTLHPDIAVITSMDADHLDIYGDKSHLEGSFNLFAGQLSENGVLIHKYGLPLNRTGISYSVIDKAKVHAANLRIENGNYYFDYENGTSILKDMMLGLPGQHNVENALAAITIGIELGIEEGKIRKALASFLGVKRRFEYIIKQNNLVFIDDYAHHPEELNACLNSVRQLYPGKKLTVAFQPHLFTRTRDFADGFAESLSKADELFLLDIYPARELPIEGVDSAMILNKININNKQLCSKANLVDLISKTNIEVLVTVGAGDIDTLVQPLKKMLEEK